MKAVIIPDRIDGHCRKLLLERKAGSEITFLFVGFQDFERSQVSRAYGSKDIAGADYPCGDSVNACIEIIECAVDSF